MGTYAEALTQLTTYKPLGPAYIILGGVAAGEGAVIAKTYNVSVRRARVEPAISWPRARCLLSRRWWARTWLRRYSLPSYNLTYTAPTSPQAEKKGIPWNVNSDVWPLQEALDAGSFFVLETNYDRTGPPPSFDDRRYPAQNCLKDMGPAKLDAESLWHVMTSNPTRNALTTFTMVMSAGKGHFEAYKTGCSPGKHCSPF